MSDADDDKLSEEEAKIVNKYPVLFAQIGMSVQESCMYWGFECPSNWLGIIEQLSKELTDLMEETGMVIEFAQIKEKYGTLRAYIDIKTNASKEAYDKAYDIINKYERMTAKVCSVEGCRSESKLRKGGWIVSLCDEHYEARQKTKEKS